MEIPGNGCGVGEPYVAKARERVEITEPADTKTWKYAKKEIDARVRKLGGVIADRKKLFSASEVLVAYPELFGDFRVDEKELSAPQDVIAAYSKIAEFEQRTAEDQIRNLNSMVTDKGITASFDLEMGIRYEKGPGTPLEVAITINKRPVVPEVRYFSDFVANPHDFAKTAAILGAHETLVNNRSPVSAIIAERYDEVKSKFAQAIEEGIMKLVGEGY